MHHGTNRDEFPRLCQGATQPLHHAFASPFDPSHSNNVFALIFSCHLGASTASMWVAGWFFEALRKPSRFEIGRLGVPNPLPYTCLSLRPTISARLMCRQLLINTEFSHIPAFSPILITSYTKHTKISLHFFRSSTTVASDLTTIKTLAQQ